MKKAETYDRYAQHAYTSCSDKHPDNAGFNGCPRCTRLELARLAKLDAQPDTVALQARIAGLAQDLDEAERELAALQLAAQAGQEQIEIQSDEIVTALYRRFKEWSKRGFSADDVTWCEVKADVIALIGIRAAPPAPANSLAIVQAALEAAEVLSSNNWRGDIVDRINDAISKMPQTIIDAARGK